MQTVEEKRQRAHQLMVEAIELLDNSDCALAAAHLEWAIELIPPPTDGSARFRAQDTAPFSWSSQNNIVDRSPDE